MPRTSTLGTGEACRAETVMEGERTQTTGGQVKREHSASLEKDHKLL